MTDRELEQKLARAVERAAPDDLSNVLSRCGDRKGSVIAMTTKKKTGKIWKAAVAACLALLLMGGGGGAYYYQACAVASVVSLDVNPSIELKVNRNEKVLSCAALNEDAAAVLLDMDGGADLVGTKLDVAVNAIVGALVRAGYLDSISSAILISVEDKDQSRAEKLQEELRTIVDQALGHDSGTEILSQVLTEEPAAEDPTQAFLEKYAGISKGKMSLIMKVMQMNGTDQTNSTTALDQLCALSVEELSGLLEHEITEIPIGKSAACWNAQEYAGTLVLSSVVAGENDVDPEFGASRPHYEVELHTPWGKDFDYLVDAFTGEVYSGKADILDLERNAQPDDPNAAVIGGADGPTAILTAPTPSYIGTDVAKKAALDHAGVAEADAVALYVNSDWEDAHYDVEFYVGGYKYECEIDMLTAAVLKFEKERDDLGVIGGADGPTAILTAPTLPAAPSQAVPSYLSAEEAFNAAAAYCSAQHPELEGYNLLNIETERDGEKYEVTFICNGHEFEYDVDARSGAVLKEDTDYRKPDAQARANPAVTEAQAKAAAFAHAGCAEADASYCAAYLDYDGGVPECWNVEFCWGGNTYEYEVSCHDCSVLDWDCEACYDHQSCVSCHSGSHHSGGHHHGRSC